SLGSDYAPVQGEKFVIISNSNGNINNGAITGQFANQTVNAAAGSEEVPFQVGYQGTAAVTVQALASVTTTQASSTANPSHPGDSVTLIAKVTTRTAPVTVGTVMFQQGGRTLGTVPLAGDGTARLPVSGLSIGNDPITATYSGSQQNGTNDLGSS